MRLARRFCGCLAALVLALADAAAAHAGEAFRLDPLLTSQLPELARPGAAEFAAARESVAGREVRGLRVAGNELHVFYPLAFDDVTIVEQGAQRVVLRPRRATSAAAEALDGRLAYAGAYASVDAVHVAMPQRSEEFLVLHDRRAPLAFEYEILETRGVSRIALTGGAIRFLRSETTGRATANAFVRAGGELQIEKAIIIDSSGKRRDDAASWSIEDAGRLLRLTIRDDGLAFPLIVDPTWIITGMIELREWGSATLLANGRVLLAGGTASSAAQVIDPLSGMVSATANTMATPRRFHTATPLRTGKVLITGGASVNDFTAPPMNVAELFDPSTKTFSGTSSMLTARLFHSATLLRNGKVLIAGGRNAAGALSSAELYDPATGDFTATGTMVTARWGHTATLLPDGRVLFAGGSTTSEPTGRTSTAEIYAPATGHFTATVAMNVARIGHSATLLADGRVFVAGNDDAADGMTTEIFDPSVPSFTSACDMPGDRYLHSATLLPNGRVLIASGSSTGPALDAWLYDVSLNSFSPAGSLIAVRPQPQGVLLPSGDVLVVGNNIFGERYIAGGGAFSGTDSTANAAIDATATLLSTGAVLVAGGNDGAMIGTAELYGPAAPTFTATDSLTTPRYAHTSTLLANGNVLIAGGFLGAGAVSAELYRTSSGTFASLPPLVQARANHTSTLLGDGRVLLAGGWDSGHALTATEIYDPGRNQFESTGGMADARAMHSATMVGNGHVLIAGGWNGTEMDSIEFYSPSTGVFASSLEDLNVARFGHTATLLPEDRVLIAGGDDGTGPTTSMELFDVGAMDCEVITPMTTPREAHTATVLPGGAVLIAGGITAGGVRTNKAEIFDPASHHVFPTGNLLVARAGHTATLLPSGKVLFTGGGTNIAELYDPGLGFSEALRPVITAAPLRLCIPDSAVFSGTGFTGVSEANSGQGWSSASNAPLFRAQRLEGGSLSFASPTAWTTTSFTTTTLTDAPQGYYRSQIVSNAIPSIDRVIQVGVSTPPTLGTYAGATVSAGGTTSAPASLPPVYHGIYAGLSASAGATFEGTMSVNRATGQVSISNAGPVGAYTVTVTANTTCATATRTFGLTVTALPAPTGLVATATSASQVVLDWNAVAGAASYRVYRSSGGGPFALVASPVSTSWTNNGLAANTSYVYRVRAADAWNTLGAQSTPDAATTVLFTDPALAAGTVIRAAHVTQLRTAVNALRAAAGLPAFTFTDAALTGVVVKALHIVQLQTQVSAARSALGLPPLMFVLPAPGHVVHADDILDLRDAVN